MSIRLQYQITTSQGAQWIDCADRTEEFMGRAMRLETCLGEEQERRTHSRDEIEAVLLSGNQVKWETDWDSCLRCGDVADARQARLDARRAEAAASRPARPAFRCHQCGCTRDTTLRGHCDDCEG